LKPPERFLGVHYFMPADTAPVVEVMAGLLTSRAEVDRVADALRRTGKEPVVLYKPIVGFSSTASSTRSCTKPIT